MHSGSCSFDHGLGRSGRIVLAAALAATLLGFAGCQALRKKEKLSRTQEIEVVDPDRLRVDVLNYLDSVQAQYIGAMSTIAANTEDRAVREATIRMKISVADVVAAIIREPDARTAFVYAWAFAAGGRRNLTEGSMKDAFTDQQQLIVDVAQRAEAEIIRIGRDHFDDQIIEEAKDEIEEIARRVTAADLLANRDVIAKVKSGIGADVAGLMLVPLTSLQGVASTPEAVNNIARVVASLSNQLDLMPRRIRWEAELLTLEIESQRTVVQASEDFNQLTNSFEVVANKIDGLPEELRSQTEDLLQGVEKLQPEFRATLAQGEKTAAQVREVTQNVRETLSELQPLVSDIREMKGKPDPNKVPVDTMAVLEQSNTLAHQTHAIVTELRQLLTDLKAPLGPSSTIAQTKDHAHRLLDAIMLRAIILILVLACAVMAVLLFKRLILRRFVPVSQK